MKRTFARWGLAALGSLALCGAAAAQTPTVPAMLAIKPKFDDVAISIPAPEELASCKVEGVVIGSKPAGFALVDGRRQTLRRFYASKNPAKMDTWSFYKDGVEVYRQHDANLDGKVDNYRWLGTGGMKWGLDLNQDGSIDSWRMISADEVAYEAFVALAERDFNRLKALLISAEEMQSLGLASNHVAAILKAQQAAPQKFQQTLTKMPNLAKATFVRVDGIPGCWPADTTGASQDLIKFASRSVLFETTDKKHDWLQTGEIVQVGGVWRLLDVPGTSEDTHQDNNPELQKLLTLLSELDKDIPTQGPVVATYNERRAGLIEQVVPHIKEASEKETWYKQIFDNLAAAAIAGSDTAKKRLGGYRQQLVAKMPGSNLAGYAVFRELWAEYQPKISGTAKGFDAKMQEEWHDQLGKFVKEYPKADDTPEALNTLAMGTEFSGKEDEAVNWYRLIAKNFPEHPLAKHAEGAERRLKLVGNPLVLTGLTLHNNAEFNIAELKGKVAVVYYWTTQCSSCPADFATMKQRLSPLSKDVELVCVNLDSSPQDAVRYLQSNPIQATHVMQTGGETGLKGPLASYYGINILPTVFLVGRDGRVITHKLNVSDMEDALKKAVAQ
jgi:hypothetical protein